MATLALSRPVCVALNCCIDDRTLPCEGLAVKLTQLSLLYIW